MKQQLTLTVIACLFLIAACRQKEKSDQLFFNAHVFTLDPSGDTASAFVVKNGRIVAVGNPDALSKEFDVKEKTDLEGKYVYPGFNDAHSHFYGLGQFMDMADLTDTRSFEEVIAVCKTYAIHNKDAGKGQTVLFGRGWDQNKWSNKDFPSNELLNETFPSIPVLLKRVDGHAAIVNDHLLMLAHISAQTKVAGGEVVLKNGKPTGVLIDNAVELVEKILPHPGRQDQVRRLKLAEKICFEHGLTTVCDAGLDKEMIDLIDSLQRCGVLKIRIYAMISATDQNLDYYLQLEPYKTDQLNVGSFKLYGDGALGSRGACLLQPYSDMKGHAGFLLTPKEKIAEYVKRIAQSKYQLNTHCIGDSTNRLVLSLYAKYLGKGNDRRWRIEHAQVMNPNDFAYYKIYAIIPSVQPTHATSDMYWAGDRVGKERIQYAYAYKTLLQQNGWLPLGTDFPIEAVNPLYTFYAAVARKDADGFPAGGFQPENALTREEALKGITIWPARAAFEENEKGSITPGKLADFTVLDVNLLTDSLPVIRNARVQATYVHGKKVY